MAFWLEELMICVSCSVSGSVTAVGAMAPKKATLPKPSITGLLERPGLPNCGLVQLMTTPAELARFCCAAGRPGTGPLAVPDAGAGPARLFRTQMTLVVIVASAEEATISGRAVPAAATTHAQREDKRISHLLFGPAFADRVQTGMETAARPRIPCGKPTS